MEDVKIIKGRTIYLSDDLYKVIKIMSVKQDVSVSKLIESVLSDYAKNSESDYAKSNESVSLMDL
jgi:hypothetical protein